MAGNHGHHHYHDNTSSHNSKGRGQSPSPIIGLCGFLKDDDRKWDNTFRATIQSWKLTIRNSKEFHAGNITLLEKIQSKTADKRTKKHGNADHTIAIDSGCPPHNNRNINNEIKNTKNSFYLINTHGHHDHILGNSIFSDAGANIIAHANARKQMVALKDFDPTGLPDITFRDEMSLFVDDIVVRLIHLPAGHTNGDLAIWVPKLNLLFTGDTYMTGGYPLIDLRSGTIRGLIKAITTMIRLAGDDTLIIPGHGNLEKKADGTIEGPNREDLIQYRHMLRTVTAEVEKLKQLGYSLQEINTQKPTQNFDREWDKNLICPENFVSFIYNSLPGKKDTITPCSDSHRVDFSPPRQQKKASKKRFKTEQLDRKNKIIPQDCLAKEGIILPHDELIGTSKARTILDVESTQSSGWRQMNTSGHQWFDDRSRENKLVLEINTSEPNTVFNDSLNPSDIALTGLNFFHTTPENVANLSSNLQMT